MAEILLLGPDGVIARDVRAVLRQDGHRVICHREMRGWAGLERELRPDVIVGPADHPDSVLCDAVSVTERFPAPLLLVQHDLDFRRDLFLSERLVDTITPPLDAAEMLARVDALVRVYRHIRQEASTRPETGPRGSDLFNGFCGFVRRLPALLGSRVPRHDKPLGPYLEIAARLAEWADRRDAFAPGHAERVATCSALIAEELGLDDRYSASLSRAAMLHDIGKAGLPVELLHRQRPLDQDDLRRVRSHAQRGARLLRQLDPDDDVVEAVLYHHEQPDGLGYFGLAGDTIPLTARILAVAEIYDGMTHSRLRLRVPQAEALVWLQERRGGEVDAACVDALARTLGRIVPVFA